MSGATRRPLAERLVSLIEPVAAGRGCDLEDVVVQTVGRRRLVRVLVDRDGGLSLDDAADLSREISTLLDDDGLLGEMPYVLEVGSPGVDRPLTQPRQWRRARNRLVRVGVAGHGTVLARVLAADEDGITLLLDGSGPARELSVPYEDLSAGSVQVEFDRPGADGEEGGPQ